MHKRQNIHNYNIYFLLLIPTVFAILALNGFGFFFKSGSAGAGILIILFAWFGKWGKFKDIWMIVGAFFFSISGDWFLSHMNGDTNMFISGISLFFIAHIGYLSFALMNGKIKWIFTLIVLAGYLILFFIRVYPSFEDSRLMIAVLIYLLISCFSLGASVGIKAIPGIRLSYILGIALILFSDTIISFKEFVGHNNLNFLILPTYYLAHILITFSLMRKSELT